MVGIYKILNNVNNKLYVGSSLDVKQRLRLHKSHLVKGIHCNKHLQSSFNKYGIDAFDFIILEECISSELIIKEQFWIDSLCCCDPKIGYNKRLIAENNTGLKRSDETRRKISESKKGKCFLSKEHYEKIAESKRGKENLAAKEYWNSLSDDEQLKKVKKANNQRQKNAKNRGSYFSSKGLKSIKELRGIKIYKYDKNYQLVNTYLSIADALRDMNMSPKNSKCITNHLDKATIYKEHLWYSIELHNSDVMIEPGELLENPKASLPE